MENVTMPKRLREIATRLQAEWPGEFDNWAKWIAIAATRIENLECALKDAVSTACENARERDNWRHKHGIVEAELTANERVLSEILKDKLHHCTMGVGCDEYGVCYADAHNQPEQCPARFNT